MRRGATHPPADAAAEPPKERHKPPGAAAAASTATPQPPVNAGCAAKRAASPGDAPRACVPQQGLRAERHAAPRSGGVFAHDPYGYGSYRHDPYPAAGEGPPRRPVATAVTPDGLVAHTIVAEEYYGTHVAADVDHLRWQHQAANGCDLAPTTTTQPSPADSAPSPPPAQPLARSSRVEPATGARVESVPARHDPPRPDTGNSPPADCSGAPERGRDAAALPAGAAAAAADTAAEMVVHIRAGGACRSVRVSARGSVAALKAVAVPWAAAALGVPDGAVCLQYAGAVLAYDWRSIRDYNIQRGASVTALARRVGGMPSAEAGGDGAGTANAGGGGGDPALKRARRDGGAAAKRVDPSR
eukprot:gene14839-21811_t